MSNTDTLAEADILMVPAITTPKPIHPFEGRGLGLAPYKFIGMTVEKYQACHGAPIQPGTSCDYCGTGIMDAYHIKSADGQRFKVGSDCIAKLNRACAKTEFEREARKLHNAVLKVKRERQHAAADARADRAAELLEQHREELEQINRPPAGITVARPNGFVQSVARWADWMLANAGRKGKLEVARELERIAAERGW